MFRTIRSYSSSYSHRPLINIFKKHDLGEKLNVKGWVKSMRKMKQNTFIDISDGSCDKKLQIVIDSKKKSNTLSTGASVEITGCLGTTPKGQLELSADNINVIGECVVSDGYPFTPRNVYPPEYVRNYPHFRSRTNVFGSLLRVRHNCTKAIHDYFHNNGFFYVHTPILTSNDCEGAGETFVVQPDNMELLKTMAHEGVPLEQAYFNTKAFLTVSGQLHLEAIAHGLSKVYSFGPTFRAENSKSRLHLSEFYMIEGEVAFIEKLEEICEVIEDLLKTVTKSVLDGCNEDVARIQGSEKRTHSWVDKKFSIITYDEATSILEKNMDKLNVPVSKREGFTKEQEVLLVELNGNVPIFVVNWPKCMKPFYMKTCKEDTSKVAALDLLGPYVGEIVGGSLREDNYEVLKSNVPKGKNDLDWYLELRKFGGVPTAGFGMGFERYLQMLLGINNIKDTIPFPRTPHNCRL